MLKQLRDLDAQVEQLSREARDRRARLASGRRRVASAFRAACASPTALTSAAGAGFLFERWIGRRRTGADGEDAGAHRAAASPLLRTVLKLAVPALISHLLSKPEVGDTGTP